MRTLEEKSNDKIKSNLALDLAKEKEKQEINNGYRTMILGKSTVLARPKNFIKRQEQGYKFIK